MEQIKFFFQYLLAPLIIAIVGGLITINLQTNQRHLEEMKFTEQIIKDAYDTSNVARGLAICMLIKPVLKGNPDYADSLIKSINSFYASRVKEAARNGDVAAIQNIRTLSADFGSSTAGLAKQIDTSQVISKTQAAKDFEAKGFQYLDEKNLGAAADAFGNAEKTYNGFHNAYEITRILKTAQKTNSKQADNNATNADSVIQSIKLKYPWRGK